MALIKGEGTHQILYGAADIFSGLRHNRGYLTRPTHSGAFPTLLLVHGRDGITASVKAFARRMARFGLAVVGPDLYRGAAGDWPGDRQIVADLGDTAQWIASSDTPWVEPGRLGLLALDSAASGALAFASGSDLVQAVVLISPRLEAPIGDPTAPTLAFYGKDDDVVPAEERRATQDALSTAEWVLYGGVGHGLIDESAADYRWEVAEDLADRTVEHYKQAL